MAFCTWSMHLMNFLVNSRTGDINKLCNFNLALLCCSLLCCTCLLSCSGGFSITGHNKLWPYMYTKLIFLSQYYNYVLYMYI